MKNELRNAAIEGFSDSFRFAGLVIATFVATLVGLMSSFAHHQSSAAPAKGNDRDFHMSR